MAREFVWLSQANAELIEAMEHLEEQQPGLGLQLFEEVLRAIEPTAVFPQAFAEVSTGIRRVLTQRFSYGVFYQFDDDKVYVLAVVHTSRSSDSWP